ncbi:predicted protein [Thalassiosira pseudonana CCMP1335]|uniref:Uncharacterized protein n=1 Tax=Thalassiosira pseudonana TaxID=35128 RepID=B8BW19_THAPS|nr:predicted protein [Thalassiosira pseudonana CCMP1335]EED95557.1 predicted protein [Thalassiosira pseudonana CCMP1335]
MKSWQPLLDPKWVIGVYLLIGAAFIPTGESSVPCIVCAAAVASGVGTCQIVMKVPDDKGDLEPPVLVHYELYNFYQNYRKYTTSKDVYQLLGSLTQDAVSASDCEPLNKIGEVKINPCGLIANTLFNDVITLESIVGPDGVVIENAPLVESGIAWQSDLEWKYKQPNGFRSEQYDNTTQYLYETYPMVVNPLEGVTNEHFVVWMRTAALPHFRKLYGYIEQTIPAGSTLTFNVMANFAVERSEGAKALVVSNTYIFGGQNPWLGNLFIIVGGIAAGLGLLFLAKELIAPRKIADKRYLRYKEE